MVPLMTSPPPQVSSSPPPQVSSSTQTSNTNKNTKKSLPLLHQAPASSTLGAAGKAKKKFLLGMASSSSSSAPYAAQSGPYPATPASPGLSNLTGPTLPPPSLLLVQVGPQKPGYMTLFLRFINRLFLFLNASFFIGFTIPSRYHPKIEFTMIEIGIYAMILCSVTCSKFSMDSEKDAKPIVHYLCTFTSFLCTAGVGIVVALGIINLSPHT